MRIVLLSAATPVLPMSILLSPVERFFPAPLPTAMLDEPVVLLSSASTPVAVLSIPVVRLDRALLPSIALLALESVSAASCACADGDSAKQTHTMVIRGVTISLLESMFEFFIGINPLIRVLTKLGQQVPDYLQRPGSFPWV